MKLFFSLAALVGFASAACPNACSGHGTCNSMDQCNCYAESTKPGAKALWRGADCSLMTCPRWTSWSAVKSGSKFAHSPMVECSDGGVCDTSTGECTCYPGYEGSACQRTSCPNDCSGHGVCRSNQDFAVDYSEAVFKAQNAEHPTLVKDSYYDYFLVTYDDAWDAGMQYGCLCDVGFRGVDCNTVECPTSYDAMDEETCKKYSEWEKWGTYASNKDAIVDPVTKTSKSPSLNGQGNTILIREWHNPKSLTGGRGDAPVPYNPIEEYPCNGAPAGDYCSGRGTCDTSSGICQCFQGFTGPACEEVADIF